MAKLIRMWSMPYQVMLIVEHSSGVLYFNQVGGTDCLQCKLEGVLAPIDLSADSVEKIMSLEYRSASQGIDSTVADSVDEILSKDPEGSLVRVDRDRLLESIEAWIFVIIHSTPNASSSENVDSNENLDYPGSTLGFGVARGVLTWPNSD